MTSVAGVVANKGGARFNKNASQEESWKKPPFVC